jgi:hypothetical protein
MKYYFLHQVLIFPGIIPAPLYFPVPKNLRPNQLTLLLNGNDGQLHPLAALPPAKNY